MIRIPQTIRFSVPAVAVAVTLLGIVFFCWGILFLAGEELSTPVRLKVLLFAALFGCAWLAAVAGLLSAALKRPCRILSGLVADGENLAQGTIRVATAGGRGAEAGIVADSLQRMSSFLNTALSDVVISSNSLFSSGITLDSNAERFAANAAEQSEKAHRISDAAEEMSSMIGEIARNAATVSETSTMALRIVNEGKDVARTAVDMTGSVLATTTDLSDIIGRLNDRILEIGDFVQVVEQIADQTNLLALNAAIEAARSGEHGRGFAVVADEVRELANRTLRATTEIATKIQSLQKESSATAAAMGNASAEVKETTECIRKVGDSFVQIDESFLRVNDQVARMAQALEQQGATTREVAEGIETSWELSREMGEMSGAVAAEVKALGAITDKLMQSLGSLRLDAHFRSGSFVGTIAEHPEITSMARSRQEHFLRTVAQRNPFVELLYITDVRGRQVTVNIAADDSFSTSYGTDGFGMDWSDRAWFKGVISQGDMFISDLYRSAATDVFCFTVAAPLLDTHGRLAGVLGADINFEKCCQDEKSRSAA